MKITKQKHALKSFSSSYNVEIFNSFNSELQLKVTESAIKSKLMDLLSQLKGFKAVTTLALVFEKLESEDKTKFDTFYLNSKAETIINESDIYDVFQSIYTKIISNIQKSLGKAQAGLTIQSLTIILVFQSIILSKKHLKLPKELDHPRRGLINIQNIDNNECFKWPIVRYLNPTDHNSKRITKANKDFAKKLDFKDKISSQN